MMGTMTTERFGEVLMPEGIDSLDAFREWRHSEGVPEKLKAHFLNGNLWLDLTVEELFSHNRVKSALYGALIPIVKREKLGHFHPDGMLLTNDDAGLATEPDGMFVSHESLRAGRVTFRAGKKRGAVATEMIGSPDLVLEVVSRSSVDKDTEKLMSAYHDAGVTEYWLIDARAPAIRFDIYRYSDRGFAAARKAKGWVKSAVFGRSFRLVRVEEEGQHPDYTLEVR